MKVSNAIYPKPELWDAVGLVEYPSREEFIRIVSLPEAQEISIHREAGLAGQLLIQTDHGLF